MTSDNTRKNVWSQMEYHLYIFFFLFSTNFIFILLYIYWTVCTSCLNISYENIYQIFSMHNVKPVKQKSYIVCRAGYNVKLTSAQEKIVLLKIYQPTHCWLFIFGAAHTHNEHVTRKLYIVLKAAFSLLLFLFFVINKIQQKNWMAYQLEAF
jgi:hypothetical protein